MATMILLENGPILFDGPVTLTGDGKEITLGGKVALCRCGASLSKPICDGSHKTCGFKANHMEIRDGNESQNSG